MDVQKCLVDVQEARSLDKTEQAKVLMICDQCVDRDVGKKSNLRIKQAIK